MESKTLTHNGKEYTIEIHGKLQDRFWQVFIINGNESCFHLIEKLSHEVYIKLIEEEDWTETRKF